jgi:hypothetical protein
MKMMVCFKAMLDVHSTTWKAIFGIKYKVTLFPFQSGTAFVAQV